MIFSDVDLVTNRNSVLFIVGYVHRLIIKQENSGSVNELYVLPSQFLLSAFIY